MTAIWLSGRVSPRVATKNEVFLIPCASSYIELFHTISIAVLSCNSKKTDSLTSFVVRAFERLGLPEWWRNA